MQKFKNDLKPYTNLQNYKQFLVPILIMFGIYLLGISSIIRANVSYIDDLGRAIEGYQRWERESRYISDILSAIIHTDIRLTDISPLPQIFAALFLAISSVLLVYILCGKNSKKGKISTLALIASIPVGLSPYFLQCLSYKFDAPYMTISILASIVPFIFIKNKRIFAVISVISVLIMCMTYQTSSGIYIMIALMLAFQKWILKKKNNKEIFIFLLTAALSYGIAMLIFRFALMRPLNSYVSTGTHALNEMFAGITNNLIIYAKNVYRGIPVIWKILVVSLVICFVAKTIFVSRQNKIITIFISILIIAVLFAVSFGSFLVLKTPTFSPRAIYGIGIVIALLGIFTANMPPKYLTIPAIILCWCLLVFAFSYGNALYNQKKYTDFREEILANDISTLFPDKQKQLSICIKGSTGLHVSVQNAMKSNPYIVELLHQTQLGDGSYNFWKQYPIFRYYDLNITRDDNIKEEDLKILLDTRYHTIKSDGEQVLVILK